MESAKKTISNLVGYGGETDQTTGTTGNTTGGTTGTGTHNSNNFSSAGTSHTSSSTAATHDTTSSSATNTKSAPTVHDITTSKGVESSHHHSGGAHHTAGFKHEGTHHQEGTQFQPGTGTNTGTQQQEGVQQGSQHHHHDHTKHHHEGSHHREHDPDVQTPDQGPDPALVGEPAGTSSGKLTGTAEPGSHSAVFGLTPDGHKETKTDSRSTPIHPASSAGRGSSNKAEKNDDSSRAPTGSGVHEQMNRPDQGPKGLERTDPAPAAPGSDKPGAGTANPLP